LASSDSHFLRFCTAVAICIVWCGAALAESRVRIETALGPITVSLDETHAPVTVANFLRYVKALAYRDGRFTRTVTTEPDNQPVNTVKIDVIQAGPSPGSKTFPPIPLERTSFSELRHVNGAISMARSGPDTATAGFFICIGDQRELDFGGKRNPDGQGFAVFGRVVSGMDTVLKIHRSRAEGQTLMPPVRIVKIVPE
jgi:peptidyl-prolyl cis-trans isomerase A (cyclophilin A)